MYFNGQPHTFAIGTSMVPSSLCGALGITNRSPASMRSWSATIDSISPDRIHRSGSGRWKLKSGCPNAPNSSASVTSNP